MRTQIRFLVALVSFLALTLAVGGCKDDEPLKMVTKVKRPDEKKEKAEKMAEMKRLKALKMKEMRAKAEEAAEEAKAAMMEEMRRNAEEAYGKKREQFIILYKALEECALDVETKAAELKGLETKAHQLVDDAKKEMGVIGDMFLSKINIPTFDEAAALEEIPELPPMEEVVPPETVPTDGSVPRVAPEMAHVNIDELLNACEWQQKKLAVIMVGANAGVGTLEQKLTEARAAYRKGMKYADNLYAALVHQRFDYVNKCLVKIRRLDRKFTGGKVWGIVTKNVEKISTKQYLAALLASGYGECVNGYTESGIDHYKVARKKGVHYLITSFLIKKCKKGTRLPLRECK